MRFLWYTPTQYCRLSPVELEIGAKRCNAGEYSVCIEPNGDVLAVSVVLCLRGQYPARPVGIDLEQSSCSLASATGKRILRSMVCRKNAGNVPIWPLCGGGCRIEREAADGNRVASGSCGGCAGGCGSDGHAVGFVGIENLRFPDDARATCRHARRTGWSDSAVPTAQRLLARHGTAVSGLRRKPGFQLQSTHGQHDDSPEITHDHKGLAVATRSRHR